MRSALWLLALFGIAVAVALVAGNNQAVVTLFWPPHRVDISFNLLVLLLAGLWTLLYLALRAVSAVFSLPAEARRWRAQQKERAMYAAFMDALSHLMAGRFIRAAKLAQNALTQEKSLSQLAKTSRDVGSYSAGRATQLRLLAHLLAAESAQALQNKALRDEHLQQALETSTHRSAQETREGVQLRAAGWATDDRDPTAALALLNELPQGTARRTLALRIKLRATQQARQTPQALETARLLAKHRAFSPAAAQSLVRGLALELLRGAHDPAQLQAAWLSLDANERAMPELVIHAVSRLMALHGDADLARAWLLQVWEPVMQPRSEIGDNLRIKLIQVLEAGLASIDAAWLARIETAQQQRPRDANMQYLAGMACLKRQLWGKAQQLLSQAVPALQDAGLHRNAWRALALLAEQRGDEVAATQAYKRAAEV
ncbi:MAG: heme biosynthesis HemY N-terminal domain-containing protein [Herminiimonas sp.]|uniref:heme biosynthesis HemY N-terminal domain-containing protein n=1 Tax=Herminiimonas sp. TaxID=1926289 RepID=UPI002724DAF6|nr:heme biosynthesis HemY N-terminal domain-containing protein [Herminiimonas sp.]MDO9419464.1 heme biosynthesis HemY N-terminal domain-containing protein [Herminiimonas sp.]